MKYGAKGAKWAKWSGDDKDSKAIPACEEAQEIVGINEVNESLDTSEGIAYGDNKEEIRITEVTGGTLDTSMVYCNVACSAEMLGTATDGNDGLSYGDDDLAPYGSYGFYNTIMDTEKNRYYNVMYYPKVQAQINDSNDNKTRESDISMEYEKIKFRVFVPTCKLYKIEKRFASEEEAIAYLSGLFAGTSAVPGLSEDAETSDAN